MEISFDDQRNLRIGIDKIIRSKNKNMRLRTMGLMLKRQFFVLFLFFLVFFAVLGFELSVVFGNKDHKVITILLVVELVVLNKLTKFCQILKMNVGSLEQNEEGYPYDNYFIHPEASKLRIKQALR